MRGLFVAAMAICLALAFGGRIALAVGNCDALLADGIRDKTRIRTGSSDIESKMASACAAYHSYKSSNESDSAQLDLITEAFGLGASGSHSHQEIEDFGEAACSQASDFKSIAAADDECYDIASKPVVDAYVACMSSQDLNWDYEPSGAGDYVTLSLYWDAPGGQSNLTGLTASQFSGKKTSLRTLTLTRDKENGLPSGLAASIKSRFAQGSMRDSASATISVNGVVKGQNVTCDTDSPIVSASYSHPYTLGRNAVSITCRRPIVTTDKAFRNSDNILVVADALDFTVRTAAGDVHVFRQAIPVAQILPVGDRVPIGSVIDWYRPTPTTPPPDGYAVCDGTVTIHDANSPLDGVLVPNLIGKMVRGLDPNQALSIDLSQAMGVPIQYQGFHSGVKSTSNINGPPLGANGDGYHLNGGDHNGSPQVAGLDHFHAYSVDVDAANLGVPVPPVVGLVKILRYR